MIDAVVTWVDTTEPTIKNKLSSINSDYSSNRIGKRDSLKYCLRGLYYNLPWLDNIYLVTNNQWPRWLDEELCKNLSPKIIRIDHKEIHPYNRPMYGAPAIEICINNIPNLSEYFLFLNDDQFIIRNMDKAEWINKEGKGIYRSCYHLTYEDYKKDKEDIDFYKWAIIKPYEIVSTIYDNVEFMIFLHQASIMCKKSFDIAKDKFPSLYHDTINLQSKVSSPIITRIVLEYIALKENLCEEQKYYKDALFIDNHDSEVNINSINIEENIKLLCINNIYDLSTINILDKFLPNKIPSEL